MSEKRSRSTKDIAKYVFVLAIGGLFGFVVFSIYMAWQKNPHVFVGILWAVAIFTVAYCLAKVHKYSVENDRLKAEVRDLQEVIMSRVRPTAPSEPQRIKSGLLVEKGEPELQQVMQSVEETLGEYSYWDLDKLKRDWKQSRTFTGKILNWQKFWTRKPHRDRSLTRKQIIELEKEIKMEKVS